MFKTENRYMTRKVAEEIPLEINILLWNLIDELNVEKDYLQVFELNSIGEGIVEVIHSKKYQNTKVAYTYIMKKLKNIRSYTL